MKIINLKKSNRKIGRPICEWAKNLKSGDYTVQQLVDITGQNENNIRQFMSRHCKSENITHKKSNGSIIAVYHWINKNEEKLCENLL